MRHGDLHSDDMTAFLVLEAALCECDERYTDGICRCGWDER